MTRLDLINCAYKIIEESKKPLSFKDLFTKVCKKLKIKENEQQEYLANFYSDIMLDSRVVFIENKFDLRKRNVVDKCIVKEEFEEDEEIEDEDKEVDDCEEDNIDY